MQSAVHQQASTSPAKGESVEKPTNPNATKSRRIEVTDLDVLDEKTLTALLGKREAVEREIQKGFAEEAIPFGLYKHQGKPVWVVPKCLFNEDNIIGMMIADFARNNVKADIRLSTQDVKINQSTFDKKFIIGLWFGMSNTAPLKRSRAKQSYELGRTCVYALIVRNEFEANPQILGYSALAKDNFFFGNNPGEAAGKNKVEFYIKNKLYSMFEDTKVADMLLGIIHQTIQSVGFTNLTEQSGTKAILDNLISVDQVIVANYPRVSVKKGRREEKKSRKPNAIRSSPLYTQEEMALLRTMTSVIFDDLGALTGSKYEDAVFSEGFARVSEHISKIIKVRLECLQRFANRTKLRLQAIRKILGDNTLRKAKVSRDHLDRLLNDLVDPARELVNDINHIVDDSRLINACNYAFKKKYTTLKECRGLLYVKAMDIYKKICPKSLKVQALKVEEIKEPEEISFEKGVNTFYKMREYFANIKRLNLGLTRIAAFKLFGRCQSILAQIKGLQSQYSGVQALDRYSLDMSVKLMSNERYNDFREFTTSEFQALGVIVKQMIDQINVRLHDDIPEDLKKTLGEVYRFLQDFKENFLEIPQEIKAYTK